MPALVLLLLAIGAASDATVQERVAVSVRGQAQDLYYYPASGVGGPAGCTVAFLPGDGGWWGLAVEMAEKMAAWGCDVYGVDTKRYLESFTGRTTLTDAQVMSDLREIAGWIRQKSRAKVTLVGWSDGAGLVSVAAATDQKGCFAGVVAIGLPEKTTLAWRWRDDLTYLTKRDPSEPYVLTAPYLQRIAPLPLAVIQATTDEYGSQEQIGALLAGAGNPKRYFLVKARNHRFDGARDEFYRALQESLTWIEQMQR